MPARHPIEDKSPAPHMRARISFVPTKLQVAEFLDVDEVVELRFEVIGRAARYTVELKLSSNATAQAIAAELERAAQQVRQGLLDHARY